MKPFIISLLVCIAAARPLTRRAMINFCLDNWPQGASSCSFPGQLATPLEIKTALLRLEKTRVELFQLMNQLQDHSCTNCSNVENYRSAYCSSPLFPLNPHYVLSDSIGYNFASDANQDKVNWMFADHYSSLKSYSHYLSNSSSMTNASLLANATQTVEEFIFPILSSLQFHGSCPLQLLTYNNSVVGCSDGADHFACFVKHYTATLSSLYFLIQGYLNINPQLKHEVADVPECLALSPRPLSAHDYRTMVCGADELNCKTGQFLASLKVINSSCTSYSSGVLSWITYYTLNEFPPSANTLNMSIYLGYRKALLEHYSAFTHLVSNVEEACFTAEELENIDSIQNILVNVTNKLEHWIDVHKMCECADQSCSQPRFVIPTSTRPLTCSDSHQQLHCLASTLKLVAESTYLFMNLQPEARNTWQISCSSL